MNIAAKLMQIQCKRLALGLLLTGLMAFTGSAQLVLGKTTARTAATITHQSDLAGLWLDHTGRGAVEISTCGSKKRAKSAKKQLAKSSSRKKLSSHAALCGRIVWLAQPFDKKGKPLTDKLNKKSSRRNRKICGLKILGKVKRISKRVYDNGWIYDPEKGKYFDVELRLKSNNILQVKGYLGIKALNKTFMWRRISSNHKRCG